MRILIAVLLLTSQIAWAQTAGTVNVSANADASNNVTVTWASSPAADACALTGGGITNSNVGASGTLTDTNVTKTTTYTVACSWVKTSNTLSWVIPTLNSDGSALTDLGSFRVIYSPKGVNSNTTLTVSDPTATSLVVTPNAPGTYAYVLMACNKGGICSNPTAAVIGPPVGTATATGTATTTVVVRPAAPNQFTVQ